MSQTANKSIFSELWERRLPQFFATYIGVCWGILQFLTFASNRYGLNDSYIDKFLIFVTILIPAVLIYIYNHGKPGKDSWTKLEKFFIPGNLLIATVMAFIVGGGTSAAAASPTQVEITTDEGEQITRMVPAQSEIRQMVIFPFKTHKAEDDWVKFGLPLLMTKDLEQDMRVSVRDAATLEYYYNSHDYEIDDDIPFSTQLNIAKKTMLDYFVTGDIKKADGKWQADIKVYETNGGEVFLEKSFSSSDIYSMTDEITQAISGQMFLKENDSQFGEFTDLPASDLITSNLEAFKTYLKANHLHRYDEKYAEASQLFQKAIELDDKSAELKSAASYSFKNLGDLETCKKLISESLKQSKMLPERQQFKIKRYYWLAEDNLDNVVSLTEDWVKLYPSDFDPHEQLIFIYKITLQINKAKEIGLLAIKNGHKNRVLQDMVDLNIQTEDFQAAESYLKEYHEAYPELAKEDTRLADIHMKKGEFDAAIKVYNKHLIDDPENSTLHRSLAQVYYSDGKYEEYEASTNKALEYSVQAPDSAAIYQMQVMQYAALGQKTKMLEASDNWLNSMRTYMSEVGVVSNSMGFIGVYTLGGGDDYIKSYYKQVGQQMPQMTTVLDCLSNFMINLFKNDAVEFKKYYKDDCKALVLQGTPILQFLADGFLKSMEDNHEGAIKDFETYIEKSGIGGKEFGYLLSKEYRLLGKPEKGIKYCQDYLKTAPNSGVFLLELAQAQTALMDLEGAKLTYGKLQKIWDKAEPGFIAYDEFIELGKQIGIE